MRHCIFFLFLLAAQEPLIAQQPVCMTYDAAGNRTTRLVCGSGLADPGIPLRLEPEAAERGTDSPPLTGQIVPNPNDGRFDISLSRPIEGGNFELYGARGERLLQQAAQGERHTFQLRDLPSGNYYLILHLEGQVLGQWIVLKH